jgi:hypothetical protein
MARAAKDHECSRSSHRLTAKEDRQSAVITIANAIDKRGTGDILARPHIEFLDP